MSVIETLTEVFALASGAVELADSLIEATKGKGKKADKKDAKIGSSGYYAKIGSSGDFAKIGSSGYYAKIGSSGYYAKIGSSGDYAQIGSSGYSAQIGSSGYSAKIGSSGDYAQIGSSGDSAQIGSSGDSAQIGSSGYYAQIGSSGDYAQIGSSGDYAKIGSSGDSAKIGSSGDFAKIGSSGDFAQIDSSGEKSIVSAIGFKSVAKAKVGSWITLAEYKFENERWVVDYVKTEYVDGERIKADTFYVLYNHEFRKYVEYDEIPAAEINSKKDVHKVVTFDDFHCGRVTYVIEKDGVFSHGETIKKARESFIYKISNRDTSQYNDLNLDDIVSKEEAIKMYRVITGACEFGTKNFVKSLAKVKSSYSIRELIELTSGRYGSEKFKEFFNK